MYVELLICNLDQHNCVSTVNYEWYILREKEVLMLKRNVGKSAESSLQLLSNIFVDSDFCHNYLHTLYLFACLL